MKNIFWVCLLLFPVLLFAQEDQDMQKIVRDFGPGQHIDFGAISVSFLEVVSDSRCPTKVNCVWQGEAKVLVGININGEYMEREIVVSGGIAEIPLADEFLIKFSHLRPYPQTAAKIAPEAYCLTIAAHFPADH